MQIRSFRFTLQELGGALGDLGTLLPLMVALILINGLNVTMVLVMVGLLYIGSGLYYRLPTPVQPMKAVASIAITLGLSASVIGAAGLIMGAMLLLLSLTNIISVVTRLFPKAVVRGIQLSIGLILFRKATDMALGDQTFLSGAVHSFSLGDIVLPLGLVLAFLGLMVFLVFKGTGRFPASLALIIFGLWAGFMTEPSSMWLGNPGPSFSDAAIVLPSGIDFWAALTLLVIPQLPLTLGNAVVGASDTARVYFKDRGRRMSPRALVTSMGLANVVAGLFGAMPMCHGSGGLTAHYRLGARTGGANLMIGGLLLALGLFLGGAALSLFSLIPFAVLGVLLAIVGIYHALLARDLQGAGQIAVAATVAIMTLTQGSLAIGFGAGILLHYALRVFHSLGGPTSSRSGRWKVWSDTRWLHLGDWIPSVRTKKEASLRTHWARAALTFGKGYMPTRPGGPASSPGGSAN